MNLQVFIDTECHSHSYQFLSALNGKVQKENFTYYGMKFEGNILLELTSLIGDSDLYVSQKTLKPTYSPHKNCLQSVTCGVDSVIVPKR